MRWLAVLAVVCIIAEAKQKFGSGPEFDLDEASTSLMYAYASYCPQSYLTGWTCNYCGHNNTNGFNVTTFFSGSQHDTFGFVGIDPNSNTIVISFRGSQNLQNWISNLNFPKTIPYSNVPNAEVHEGFWEAYEELQTQVQNGFTSAYNQCPSCDVLVTGHSLGAALATLQAVEMYRTGYASSVTLHNFGSPRVGNQAFAQYVDSDLNAIEVWRMTNMADIVPHLPTEDMGFFHITTEVWRSSVDGPDGNYVVCSPTNGEDPTCADSVPVPDSIYDHLHYMSVYENCLNTGSTSTTSTTAASTYTGGSSSTTASGSSSTTASGSTTAAGTTAGGASTTASSASGSSTSTTAATGSKSSPSSGTTSSASGSGTSTTSPSQGSSSGTTTPAASSSSSTSSSTSSSSSSSSTSSTTTKPSSSSSSRRAWRNNVKINE